MTSIPFATLAMTFDQNRYDAALCHYSNARFDDALAALAPMLDRVPAHLAALDLAAVCAYSANRKQQAEVWWRRAIDEHPQDAGPYSNLGNALKDAGRLDEAQAVYRKAIELRPAFVEAQYNLANTLDQLGHRDEAEHWFREALKLKPDFVEAHYNLASLLTRAGRLPEAEAAYRQVLAARPAHAEAHNNLGNLLKDCGRLDEAAAQLRQAVAARPDWADAHYNLGNALDDQAEAERAYRNALALRPDFVGALINLGGALVRLDRVGEAEEAYRRAIAIEPDCANAHFGLGNVLFREAAQGRPERLEEAEAAYRRAIALMPDFTAAYHNLGILLGEDGARSDEAQGAFREVLRIDPESANSRLHLASALLRAGHFTEGWQCFEARYDDGLPQQVVERPSLSYPQWRGEPLAGKSLVVITEQGFGDTLQFCRYVTELKSRGAKKLTVVCPNALITLVESVDGVAQCIGRDALATLPPHDYWCFLMSVPAVVGTTLDSIPCGTPYLHVSAERVDRWRTRLPADTLKVGLVWGGVPRPWLADPLAMFSRRWFDVRHLEPLLEQRGITFVSLQKGPAVREQLATLPARLRPLEFMDDVADFADTAAIVASLDLVISVDTSVAHLAGALGKPVWVLLCSNACWRWLDARDDSPWYPTARLFRQAAPGQWDAVLARVADELATWRDERITPRSP